MRAMILAAGRGERMGDLTINTPKPLLRVGNQLLIEYAIANLVRANIRDIVINVSYLGEQIKSALGNGARYNVRIQYSEEPERLEVGGGIIKALPLLGKDPFLVMSSDIISDFPLQQLTLKQNARAHLVMIDNPPFHPQGDFGLRNGVIDMTAVPALTFANIGLYHPDLFQQQIPRHVRWRDIVGPAILKGEVTGEHYQGIWHNVGTPAELVLTNQSAKINSFS